MRFRVGAASLRAGSGSGQQPPEFGDGGVHFALAPLQLLSERAHSRIRIVQRPNRSVNLAAMRNNKVDTTGWSASNTRNGCGVLGERSDPVDLGVLLADTA